MRVISKNRSCALHARSLRQLTFDRFYRIRQDLAVLLAKQDARHAEKAIEAAVTRLRLRGISTVGSSIASSCHLSQSCQRSSSRA